ncbi:hypothetical protein ACFL6G_09790, partial [candidate division KSB1 bacterium]
TVRKDIRTIREFHGDEEEALILSIKGYRLIGDEKNLNDLEDRSASLFPNGIIAQQRTVSEKNPRLKRIYTKFLDIEAEKLSPDLVIGITADEDANPNEVFFNLDGFSVDGSGNIYALDKATFKFSIFSPEGKFLGEFGKTEGMEEYLKNLSVFDMTESGNIHAVSRTKEGGNYLIFLPDGDVWVSETNEQFGSRFNLKRHPSGYWANSLYSVYYPENDIKSEELAQFKTEKGIVEFLEINPSGEKGIEIKEKGYIGTHLTDGGTLEGKFQNFTLYTLNDVKYDFDGDGNIYIAHTTMPRFRKFNREGNLVFDLEFDFYDFDSKSITSLWSNAYYRMLFGFSTVRTTVDGISYLIRGLKIYKVSPSGEVLAILELDVDRTQSLFSINSNPNRRSYIDPGGKYLYAQSRDKIYRFKLK